MKQNQSSITKISSLNNKIILLIGGTGSFGQKFTDTILNKYNPKVIRVYSRDELKQWEMANKFTHDKRLRFFIGDIRDKTRLDRAMDDVQIVIHAAALKHIVACEYNPFEAVKTNIIGAENIIDTAINHNVEKVVGISTDKAVNPINLYGATKLCMEKIFIASNAYVGERRKTKISCVRYGNVTGSRGSVIPLFLTQKEKGVVTVTDKSMTRFWLTIEQGVEFVIKSIDRMNGGEIFVPKIPTVKIMDLVNILVPECKIKYIGIRPGEKLHEVLISEEEARHTVEVNDMYIVLPDQSWFGIKKFPNSQKLSRGFRYSSDNNSIKPNIDEIKKYLEKNFIT